MTDRYARYERLRFDRPHPRVLRIIMGLGQERPNPVDAAMHRELGEIWRDIGGELGHHHGRRPRVFRRRRLCHDRRDDG
jgi:hypothetical protein